MRAMRGGYVQSDRPRKRVCGFSRFPFLPPGLPFSLGNPPQPPIQLELALSVELAPASEPGSDECAGFDQCAGSESEWPVLASSLHAQCRTCTTPNGYASQSPE